MTAIRGETMLTLPEVKTEDGISTAGDLREARFRDPDGNIRRIHSHVET